MSHTKEDHHKHDGDGNRNSDDKRQFPSAYAKKAAIPALRICSKQPIEYENKEIKMWKIQENRPEWDRNWKNNKRSEKGWT